MSLRKRSPIEALVVFAFIMAYIWKLRAAHPNFWIVALALISLRTWRAARASALWDSGGQISACACGGSGRP